MSIMDHFTFIKEQEITEYNTMAKLWQHNQTKAKIIMLENDDANKVFGITFRTPVTNSKGIPHILEHSVLNGSKHYPSKQPFVDLLKGSLYTFLNAYTYPDRTSYPVASQNKKDFYNLVDVYLDAVFNPLLDKKTFQQEGWHYELNTAEEPLTIKGVVYNEMKGVYSDPDNTIFDTVMAQLFPDTSYRHDSGGNPDHIPELTYEEFTDFHEQYYHPSNSYIYFYGDDHSEDRFEKIHKFLKNYQYAQPDSSIKQQKPIQDIPDKVAFFDPGENNNGCLATKNWLIHDWDDFELLILNELLLGHPEAPLYKALIDSNLGEDLTPSGFETFGIQPFFMIGLKNVELQNKTKVIELIIQTLEKIHHSGFAQEDIEAALNSTEFHLRELNTGSSPRGLSIMKAMIQNWIYDKNPIEQVQFENTLHKLKGNLQKNPKYLSDKLSELLISNKHTVNVFIEPKPGLLESKEKINIVTLATQKQQLDKKEIANIAEQTKILIEHQQSTDSSEATAKLPRLNLTDLQGKPEKIDTQVEKNGSYKIISNLLQTNGITYLDLCFDIGHLSPQEYLLLPFLERGLHEFDTLELTSNQITNQLNTHTGNFSTHILNTNTLDGNTKSYLIISGKALPHKIPKLLEILEDLITNLVIDNQSKLKQFIKDETTSFQNAFIASGHSLALSYLHSNLSIPGYLNDQIGGVNRYTYLKDLKQNLENQETFKTVIKDLTSLKDRVFNSNNLIISITGQAPQIKSAKKEVDSLIQTLPKAHQAPKETDLALEQENVAFITPTKVNYNCLAMKLDYSNDDHILAILKYINLSFLWNKIRVQGGAYGSKASYSRLTKTFSIMSYRDPRNIETYNDYTALSHHLQNLELNKNQLVQSITGAIGVFDDYQLPHQKGYTQLYRHIIGRSYEDLVRVREAILTTSNKHIQSFGQALENIQNASKATITNKDTSSTYNFKNMQV